MFMPKRLKRAEILFNFQDLLYHKACSEKSIISKGTILQLVEIILEGKTGLSIYYFFNNSAVKLIILT